MNKSISVLGIRKKSGANIIGYKTSTGDFIITPSPDTKLIPGFKIFVLGTKDQIGCM